MRGRLSTKQVMRDLRQHDTFETFKSILKYVFSQRSHLKIYKCEELSEIKLSEHALVDSFDVISRCYLLTENCASRLQLLIRMKTMNARMFTLCYFVPSHDLNEYFLDYYV